MASATATPKKKLSKAKRMRRRNKTVAWVRFFIIESVILAFFFAIVLTTRPLHETDVFYVTVQTSDCLFYKSMSRYGQRFVVDGQGYALRSDYKGYFYRAVEDEKEITLTVQKPIGFGRTLGIVGIAGKNGEYFTMEEYNASNTWIPYAFVPIWIVLNGVYLFFGVAYIVMTK